MSAANDFKSRFDEAGHYGAGDGVVNVTVANGENFQNQVLATGFDLPTTIEFLPDGRMLVGELAGEIKVLPSPYTTPDPTPFLQLTNVGSAGVQQGLFDIVLDPNFASNRQYYIFYTLGIPNVDRVSRFLDDTLVTDLHEVRIVHGHGTGQLRKGIGAFLKTHPQVEKYYAAPEKQGGGGATIVELKD